MFGSSQDRARQLAGRNRRERISSISSCTSSRSISSSSQAPQQSPTSIWEPKVPSAIEEHPSCEHNDTHITPLAFAEINSSQQDENAVPLSSPLELASGLPGPQVEQQRLQAEHLSEVLYSNFALITSPPQSQFTATRHTRYGSLGTVSMPHALRGTASEYQLRPQTVVSLRGGSGSLNDALTGSKPTATDAEATALEALMSLRVGSGDRDVAPAVTTPTAAEAEAKALREHFEKLQIASSVYRASWEAEKAHLYKGGFMRKNWLPSFYQRTDPMVSGQWYDFMLSRLGTQLPRFVSLFGPSAHTTREGLRGLRSRMAFFHCLIPDLKTCFRNMIVQRINERINTPQPPDFPGVRPPIVPFFLLETFEGFVQPHIFPKLSVFYCERC
jgi:hypothetical protein